MSTQATQHNMSNLTYATPSTAIIRVDTTVGPGSVPDASTGRFSVRLESKTQYGPGLFLFDVKHTPYGCGTWPALWLTDPNNWPTNGEIDILEATNQATTSGPLVSLHTTSDCSMSDIRRSMTGTAGSEDCYNATNHNSGCGVSGPPSTYGPDFNARGGASWRLNFVANNPSAFMDAYWEFGGFQVYKAL
ncbi:hypothetical protein N0V88_002295 [Collariella sp. IMI 366227]|nr:hypothetical protein N0V88_002295 [Collariella sp. IMI 366227]